MNTTLINGDLAVRRVLALHEAVPEIDLSRRRSGPRRSGEFDPNLYLTALPHLSLKQGYRLNFWYSGGEMGARHSYIVKEREISH